LYAPGGGDVAVVRGFGVHPWHAHEVAVPGDEASGTPALPSAWPVPTPGGRPRPGGVA